MTVFGLGDLAFLGAAGGVERDPFFANVSLLLHGNGTNGSTTITDSSLTPKTVTAVGNAQISTSQSKFGGASIAFDGTGDGLTVQQTALGTADFTIETWIYYNNGSTGGTIFDCRLSDADGGNGFAFYRQANGALAVFFGAPTGQSGSLPNGTWHHVALVKSFGGVFSGYINGSQVFSFANTTNLVRATHKIGINHDNVNSGVNGYIDDFRITLGIARYTGNFTPPTAPFPDF